MITNKTSPSSSLGIVDNFDVVDTPNPANEKITVNIQFENDVNSSNVRFILYDIQGRVIINELVLRTTDIDISLLKSGMYMYEVVAPLETKTGKLSIY